MKGAKAERIRQTIRETKERRQKQKPVVYQLKLQNLTKRKRELLDRAFLEAKWLYNYLIHNLEEIRNANKLKEVFVKVGESFEQRRLNLGSQVKQEIAERIKDNLKALKNLKENGHTVGKLKPKKFVNSIPLKQYGITYYLDVSRNRVRIQKLGEFRVLGLHQIPEEAGNCQRGAGKKTRWLLPACDLLSTYLQKRKDLKGTNCQCFNEQAGSNRLWSEG